VRLLRHECARHTWLCFRGAGKISAIKLRGATSFDDCFHCDKMLRMSSDRSNHRHLPDLVRLSLLVVGAVGLVLLLLSNKALAETHRYWSDILQDALRDLGIAFIVSSVVAGLFELYRSQSHTFDGMKAVIDAVLGEQISPEVWLELKDLIAAKECIRRRGRIRLEISTHEKLPGHQRVLNVEYEYELHALTSKATKVTVSHELDYQLQCDELGLPRFRQLVVRGGSKNRTLTPEELKTYSVKGKISVDVALRPRHGHPYMIRTQRSEIVNFPGSYNLYTPEFMKDVSITFVGCPADANLEVFVRPQGKGQLLTKIDDTWSCGHLLMPGQGIEIKMMHAATTLFNAVPNPSLGEAASGERRTEGTGS
jgi:hypothetical protein